MKMFYRRLEFLGEECHPEGVVLAQFEAGVHQRMLSPRTRKVALAAFETGLVDRIRLIPSPIGINNDHPQENPLRQEPTLVTADGLALYESLLICEYLDSLHEGPKLIPASGNERWVELQRHALAEGINVAIAWCRNENRRPLEHRMEGVFKRYEPKILLELDALEAIKWPKQVGVAQLATAGMLGFMDFCGWAESYGDGRPQLDWRAGRPNLTAWFADFRLRGSMQKTRTSGEPMPDFEERARAANISPFFDRAEAGASGNARWLAWLAGAK